MNNKGADQTARMRRLVCTCVVRKPPKTGFLASRPIYRTSFFVCYHRNIALINVKIQGQFSRLHEHFVSSMNDALEVSHMA